jgi:hypothetical protein
VAAAIGYGKRWGRGMVVVGFGGGLGVGVQQRSTATSTCLALYICRGKKRDEA